jgi:hypothetical protein
MLSWMLRAIAVDEEIVDHLGDADVAFRYPHVVVIGGIILSVLALYIFRRQGRNLPNASIWLRASLTITRVVIVALLIAALADPFVKLDLETNQKPILAFLFDQSASMKLPVGLFDSPGEERRQAAAAGYNIADAPLDPRARNALAATDRAHHVQNVLDHLSPEFLGTLTNRYAVEFYSFAEELTALATDPAQPRFPKISEASGLATNLGDAIMHVLQNARDRSIAGIVVISDGQNTAGGTLDEAARAASRRPAPIFAVPAGSSSRLRDIAVTDVACANSVAVGDTVHVIGKIEASGFEKRRVSVELRENDRLLDSKELVLEESQQQQVDLAFQATQPGCHCLTIKVPPEREESELLRSNNSDCVMVQVTDQKLRVLYIEGQPRWDFRFLKNAMRRDHGLRGKAAQAPDIILEREIRRLGERATAAALPRSSKEFADYQVIILGDVSPEFLTPALVDNLDEAVRRDGVGLIVEAGPMFMPHAFGERLQGLLPVHLIGGHAGIEPEPGQRFSIELTPEGMANDALRFFDEPGRNVDAWDRLPAYGWCVAGERPAAGASVLAWNPAVRGNFGKVPIIASQRAGKGKVWLVGLDSTWLWRENVGDRYFYKFWGQAIRDVARQGGDEESQASIEIRPVHAQPRELVQIELRAPSSKEQSQRLRIHRDGSDQMLDMMPVQGVAGCYRATFSSPEPGNYRVIFDAAGGQRRIEAPLQILSASEEFRNPNVNRLALQALTAGSGGRLLELHELSSLPERLKGSSKVLSIHREASLWDNWLVLVLIICLYSVDVGLRRLAGLS